MSDTVKAKQYAEICHSGRVYGPGVPYPVHLEHVVNVLIRFGFTDSVMISAGWTHDTIEDTGISYNDLKTTVGYETAEIVYAVTNELGRNRKERNLKTYPKIRGNFLATALKLADRIANVEYGMANGGKNDMYAKEYPDFRQALYVKLGDADAKDWPESDQRIERMWGHLGVLLANQSPVMASAVTKDMDVVRQ